MSGYIGHYYYLLNGEIIVDKCSVHDGQYKFIPESLWYVYQHKYSIGVGYEIIYQII